MGLWWIHNIGEDTLKYDLTNVNKNKHFAEKTLFGKKPFKLFFSEKLQLHYILLVDTYQYIFEDGVIYEYEEVLTIQKEKNENMIKTIHALKKEFDGAKILKDEPKK